MKKLPIAESMTTVHDHSHHEEDESEIIDDYQMHFPATLFKPVTMNELVPSHCDTVVLTIDGSIKADLSWKHVRDAALAYTQRGLRIFWDLDLGLFDHLDQPLDNQSQFLSLRLSLDHFRDTLWQEFRENTLGVCIYRGRVDFGSGAGYTGYWHRALENETFQANWSMWKQRFSGVGKNVDRGSNVDRDLYRLFCSNTASEYLNLLTNRLPDTLPCMIALDVPLPFDLEEDFDPLLIAYLLNKERFPHFTLAVNNNSGLGGDVIWKEMDGSDFQFLEPELTSKIGVCLPSINVYGSDGSRLLDELLKRLQDQQKAFKIIPESLLTTQWDGLDYLVVQSTGLSPEGRRKLCGFCAAGGTIVSVGPVLNLPGEIALERWY